MQVCIFFRNKQLKYHSKFPTLTTRSTALYAASTGPDPTEHEICSSPFKSVSLTVAVERPRDPHVTCQQVIIIAKWPIRCLK